MQVTIHPGLSVEPVVHVPFGEDPLYLRIIAVGSFCYIHPGLQCTVHGEVIVVDSVGYFPGPPVCYLQNFILDDTYSAITISDNAAIMLLVTFRSYVILHQLQLFVFVGYGIVVLYLTQSSLILLLDGILQFIPCRFGFFGVEIKCG